MTTKWIKMGKTVTSEGSTNIYAYGDTGYTVESRKRHIPHANGRSGTWDHTSYFVVKDGADVKEFQTLKEAQEYVRVGVNWIEG